MRVRSAEDLTIVYGTPRRLESQRRRRKSPTSRRWCYAVWGLNFL